MKDIEIKKCDLFNNYDNLCNQIKDVEAYLKSKEGELEGVVLELNQKNQELSELNEMIEENESKYRRVIEENKETFDKTLLELRRKEEEYHNILVEIDDFSREKEQTQEDVNRLTYDVKTKEEIFDKLTKNSEYLQNEIQRMNENITALSEKEAVLVSFFISIKFIIFNRRDEFEII